MRNTISIFSLLLLLSHQALCQCIPDTKNNFFEKLISNNQLPDRLLKGRTILFYEASLSKKELEKIQESFASTGIDAVLAIELEKLLGGQDIRQAIFNSIFKREISNLVFFERDTQGYRCTITTFNQKVTFVNIKQNAWQLQKSSLNELLLQINRESLNTLQKQNLLVNEQPETALALRVITGSRIEGFTTDFKVDRVAVRLSAREAENQLLKQICAQYPFKMEFVGDSLTDVQLRQKGFWYVLNCIHANEQETKKLLGYAPSKVNVDVITTSTTSNNESIYKFYLKKLEFDNAYLGKQWDAATTWEQSLQNFIGSIRKELNIQ